MGNSTVNHPMQTLDKASLESFKRDMMSLFAKDEKESEIHGTIEPKGGHTSRWTYAGHPRPAHHDSGSDLWRHFVDAHNNYYIPKMEKALIAHHLDALANRIKGADSLIDLGSGSRFAVENKSIPLLQRTPIGIYVPVDLSRDLLTEAEQVANEQLGSDRKVMPIHGDFYFRKNGKRTARQELAFPGDSRAGVMFGSTISNMNMTVDQPFPKANIVGKLRDLGHLLKKDAKGPTSLTLAYDSNQDLHGTALEAYNSIHWKRMIVGMMIDVQTILKPPGFDAFGWEYEGVPDRSKTVIHQCIVATKAQAFMIDDVAFSIQRGDRFVVVNNIKYEPNHMKDLAIEAGFVPEEPMRLPNNHMVLHTMEIPHNEP